MSRLSLRLTWGVPVVAILVILLGGCDTAIPPSNALQEKDEMQPPTEIKMEPSAYLRGTWRNSEQADHDGIPVTRIRTLTFTKSRFIGANANLVANGMVEQWQHPGTWSATTDTITKTWHRWIPGEGREENQTIEKRRYTWVDEARTILLLQEWEADPDSQPVYREYRRVPPSSPLGVWRWSQVHPRFGVQVWEIDVAQTTVTWRYNSESPCTHIIEGPARVDDEELFLLIDVETETETATCFEGIGEVGPSVGYTTRWAFAPGHNDDTIAVSELWSELQLQADGTWADREDRPYGEYRQFFTRVVE